MAHRSRLRRPLTWNTLITLLTCSIVRFLKGPHYLRELADGDLPIFYRSTKPISRFSDRSSLAAFASGCNPRLIDARQGLGHDYERRTWVEHTNWHCSYAQAWATTAAPVGLAIMLRVYFMQQWFDLLDPSVEEALYDSPALRRFAGCVDLGVAAAPDETTVCRFHRLLEKHDLTRCKSHNTLLELNRICDLLTPWSSLAH